MTILVAVILTAMVLYGGFGIGHLVGTRGKRKLLAEGERLSAENAKLANLVLHMQNERLLLPEDVPEVEQREPEKVEEAPPSPSGIDRLIKLMETLPLSEVASQSHEEYDDNGLAGLALYRFGDLTIRDAANRFKNWSPDILFCGKWVGVLDKDQARRAREIIDNRIADILANPDDGEPSPFLRMMIRADHLLEEARKPPDHSWRKHPELWEGKR